MSEVTRSVSELGATFARRCERPRAAILGALLVLLACVACRPGVDVKVQRESSYAGRIHTLYLAIVQGVLSADQANQFVDTFRRQIGLRRVTVSARVLAGTDLDRQMVYKEVAASHADAALLVRPPHGVTASGETATLTWEVSLFDAKTGSTVWHAQVDDKNASGITEGTVDDVAQSVVEHLNSDHLLGSGD